MAYYESIYILRSDLATDQVEQVTKRVGDIIAANGGKVLRTELWGRRQLAYPIKKNTKGYYIFHILEGSGDLVGALESLLKIDEDVLKFQNVRIPEPFDTPSPLVANPDDRDRGERRGPRERVGGRDGQGSGEEGEASFGDDDGPDSPLDESGPETGEEFGG